ncbi:Zeta-sarcoglycan, partial [Gryllus bimaculatus]
MLLNTRATAVYKPPQSSTRLRSNTAATAVAAVSCNRSWSGRDDDSGVQVGIYGWRKRCLYLLILGLLVVVIVNLALTLWLLRDGMGQLRIVAGGVQLRGQALVLDALLASSIRSRRGQPISVESARNFTATARDARGRVASRLVL